VTQLRNMMLEELQRRNYSQSTTRAYVRVIRELAKHFHQPPDRLGPDPNIHARVPHYMGIYLLPRVVRIQ
jgi:hypothetical protein